MSGIISPGSGASFDTIQPPAAAQEPQEGGVDVDITGPDEGDSVDISDGAPPPVTYGPPQFSDRFRFAIANGMLDGNLRFDATDSRSRGADVVAYGERQEVEIQVTRAAGSGSPSSALFALQFQDADPNGEQVTSQVEGKAEFNRQADQNLSLLSSL